MLKQRVSLLHKPFYSAAPASASTAATIRAGLKGLPFRTGAFVSLCALVLIGASTAYANETEARNIAEEMSTLVVAANTTGDTETVETGPGARQTTSQKIEAVSASTAAQDSVQNVSDNSTPHPDTSAEDHPEQLIASSESNSIPKAKSVDLAQPISNNELNAVEEPATTKAETTEEAVTDPTEEPKETDSDTQTKAKAKPEAKPEPQETVQASEESPEADTEKAIGTDSSAETTSVTSQPSVEDSNALSQDDTDTPEPAATEEAESLLILGTKVPPATSTRLAWSPSQSFEGLSLPTPVLVVNGAENGPTLCLTAAVHGDELNGIEIVRRVLYGLDPDKLSGAVIGVPIVNLQGFRRNSRYLADRRDLNRYFPGNPNGSSASRIAYSFFNSVISHCDALVDLHTGSFDRINLPQLRADLRDKEIAKLTHNFGATVVLHSAGAPGTLRRAAAESGIPAATLEAGGPLRLEEDSVSHGVAGIQTLLNSMGMIKKFSFWGKPEPVYYQSSWIRVNHGGILFSNVELGKKIKAGDVLGTVTDPITNVRHEIVSPHEGRIIGMALNQVMLPGFAAYHIGIAAKDESKVVPEDEENPLTNDSDLSQGDPEDPDEPGASAPKSVPSSSPPTVMPTVIPTENAEEDTRLSNAQTKKTQPNVESEE